MATCEYISCQTNKWWDWVRLLLWLMSHSAGIMVSNHMIKSHVLSAKWPTWQDVRALVAYGASFAVPRSQGLLCLGHKGPGRGWPAYLYTMSSFISAQSPPTHLCEVGLLIVTSLFVWGSVAEYLCVERSWSFRSLQCLADWSFLEVCSCLHEMVDNAQVMPYNREVD